MNLIIQSIGLDPTELCPVNGPFSNGLLSLRSCISSHTESGDRSVPTLIKTAIDFCEPDNEAATSRLLTSVCCGTDDGIKALISSCDAIISN
jgi:hypothetical protein